MVAYTDKTLMPYGKYKGTALANVPPDYLLYLYDNKMMQQNGALKRYVEDNATALRLEVQKSKANRKFNAR